MKKGLKWGGSVLQGREEPKSCFSLPSYLCCDFAILEE